MLFNSSEFLIFFPMVCVGYSFCSSIIKKNAITQLFLLVVSLYFYACWNPVYLSLILISVVITYAAGIYIEKYPTYKKTVVAISLLSNLAILFFFKYYNWVADSFNSATGSATLPIFNVMLPVGISFYTFQALGYTLDVYRKRVKAERNFITYALFVTFFPQLVAGPIERTSSLLPQFKVDYHFDYDRVTSGLKLAAWGMFMKVVIADRLALYVNPVYNNVNDATGTSLVLATFFFTVQVYADFAGYSNIAIGCARILGFNLMKNFDHPYFSKSVAEFWRRWHISLGSWFRDYLYYEVAFSKWCKKICKKMSGGNRKLEGRIGSIIALGIVWVATGLWHGAAWHFVIWGMIYGLIIITSTLTEKGRKKVRLKIGLEKSEGVVRPWQFIQMIVTFLLVNFANIFFRGNNIHDIGIILRKICGTCSEISAFFGNVNKDSLRNLVMFNRNTGFGYMDGLVAIILCFVLLCVSAITRGKDGTILITKMHPLLRWLFYFVLVFSIYGLGVFNQSQFIYFQF